MKYVIKKGNHYNQSKIRAGISLLTGIVTAETFMRRFMFRFGKTRTEYLMLPTKDWYSREEIEFTGWNKLYGFSGFNHHKYSARLVWQPNFNNVGWFRIMLYVYGKGDGVWKATHLEDIKGDEYVKTSITAETGYYKGVVDNKYGIIHSDKTPHFINLEPYFGGKSAAVKDIFVYLYKSWYYKLFIK